MTESKSNGLGDNHDCTYELSEAQIMTLLFEPGPINKCKSDSIPVEDNSISCWLEDREIQDKCSQKTVNCG